MLCGWALASQTAKATEEIETRISHIQTDTDSAVDAIVDIGNIIGQISDIQSAISVAMDEQTRVTEDISRSVETTATSSDGIKDVISDVSEKRLLNKQASDQINIAANDLSSTAAQLEKLVLRFANKDVKYGKAA